MTFYMSFVPQIRKFRKALIAENPDVPSLSIGAQIDAAPVIPQNVDAETLVKNMISNNRAARGLRGAGFFVPLLATGMRGDEFVRAHLGQLRSQPRVLNGITTTEYLYRYNSAKDETSGKLLTRSWVAHANPILCPVVALMVCSALAAVAPVFLSPS